MITNHAQALEGLRATLPNGESYTILKAAPAKAKRNRDKGIMWLTLDAPFPNDLVFGREGEQFEVTR